MARFAVILFAVLQVLIPMLPHLGIGQSIGSQSDKVRTLITPAGWAFSIWGPLYGGSIAFAIYQALPSQHKNELLKFARWPPAAAFLGNALWAFYTQLYGLSVISVVIIIFTLFCLLTIYRRFATWQRTFRRGERWCVVLPLSALAAWLSVATIVNIGAALRFHGLELGDAAVPAAAAVITLGGFVAGALLIGGRGNPPYALVVLWGLAAIYAAGGQQEPWVATATAVAGVLVVIGTVVGLRRDGLSRWTGT
jgi:hypothetical protein